MVARTIGDAGGEEAGALGTSSSLIGRGGGGGADDTESVRSGGGANGGTGGGANVGRGGREDAHIGGGVVGGVRSIPGGGGSHTSILSSGLCPFDGAPLPLLSARNRSAIVIA